MTLHVVSLDGEIERTFGDVYGADNPGINIQFWDGDIPGIEAAEELASDGTIVQFGRPPNRIDLISSITGVSFEEAWPGRVEAVMVDAGRTTPIPYIGVEELVKNKRAVGRPKDLDDLDYLMGDS